ncbi:MAG: S1 RNA-binding domain-containing protein, partial [Cyclobacteriaceae bacterium]
LELPYGIEGFCSAKNLVKEDGSKVETGESLDFKVLEFSKEDRRIVLSHKAMYSAEEAPVAKKAPAGKAPSKGKTIEKINQEVEKSTLGDLEALSALKDKMNTKGE